MSPRLRVVLVSTLIVVAVLILIGATYQGVATALERRRYPHPGQLVDVGGHQLHLHCVGEGSPVVVLEAPAGSMSAVWGWVQPEVAKTTRVCGYDRAGLGWSEAGDRRYDPGRVPEELHALLAAAKQPPPYVLAGQSLGASFVRRFASLYPTETARLVLLEEQGETRRSLRFMTMAPWLARAGILRATDLLSDSWKGLPPPSAGAMKAFLNRPDHLTRAAGEIARQPADAFERALAERSENEPPVVVVRANLNDPGSARRVTEAIVAVVKETRGSRRAERGSR